VKKWIAVYDSREWLHAWVLTADSEKEAEEKASQEIREAFVKGVFGTPQVDMDAGEWLEVRPLAGSFIETT